MRGWLRRAQRQAELIGTLPPLPDTVGPGDRSPPPRASTSAARWRPSWQDRIAVGDLGYRAKAVLTRYPEGIMLQRTGAGPIWIPDESITAIRTETRHRGQGDDPRGHPRHQVAAAVGHRDRHRVSRRRPRASTRDGWRRRRDVSKAVLVLEDGRIFTGTPFGAVGQTLGEAVFSTGMSGYQETLTDPSYHGQIVVATAPQIGNTGWNHEDAESRGDKIWVAGYAVRDPSPRASNWRATGTLDDELVRQGIVGIAGIDTRAVVRHLRSLGSMKAGVFSGDALADPRRAADQGAQPAVDARRQPRGRGQHRRPPMSWNPMGRNASPSPRIDLGIKTNTPRNFARRGIRSHVLPSTVTFEQIADLKPDGVFLSNGPGDPATADHIVGVTREVLGAGIPLFGICFGNQILGRALGRSTYKMVFGHRGINVPVIDHATGRVAVTAQNHGFALEGEAGEQFDTPFGTARSATPAPTTASSRESNSLTGAPFRCNTTRRRPRVRTTPNTCSTSSST